VRKHL